MGTKWKREKKNNSQLFQGAILSAQPRNSPERKSSDYIDAVKHHVDIFYHYKLNLVQYN